MGAVMTVGCVISPPADQMSLSTSADAVALLSRPGTYPDRPPAVECIETHISWVFLTERHAYKLKKPVAYDFVDFSTLEARRLACEEEVRLNRRLAPDVYLGVVPLRRDFRGRLTLGGKGTPVEWVVAMRRLPHSQTLESLLRRGLCGPDQVERLGRFLAEFYRQLPPVTVRTEEYRRAIEEHVRANAQELLQPRHGLSPQLVRRLHDQQLRYLALWPAIFDRRVCDGRIVDGHGDLRPEHIYFLPEPVVIDGIEFDRQLRQLDVVDELSFLAMECDQLGAPQVGQRILQHYVRAAGDQPPDSLVAFYKAYRACVRAKVHALRADQTEAPPHEVQLERTRRYLELAEKYHPRLGPTWLLVVRGLSGSGKSTVARALAEQLCMECLQTDAVRREMFESQPAPADFDQGCYEPQKRQAVYMRLFEQAGQRLAQGLSVILDGTFLSAASRREAVALADRYGAQPVIVVCRCPDMLADQRIARRLESGEALSDARAETRQGQRQLEEPDETPLPTCELDTTRSISTAVGAVCNFLRLSTVVS